MIVIKLDKLLAKEESIGKVRIVQEGFGEVKNNSVIIRKIKITELEFIRQDPQNRQ